MKKLTIPRALRRRLRSRQGVALVLTLGILALLLIMMMSFAFTSRLDRGAAVTYLDAVRARQQADTALSQAIKLVRKDLATLSSSDDYYRHYGEAFPSTPSTATGWYDRRFMYPPLASANSTDLRAAADSALAVTWGGYAYIPDSNDNFPTMHSYIGFDSVVARVDLDGDGTGGDSVVGLFTYLMIDESGKLDPNACFVNGLTENNLKSRLGDSMAEVNLPPVFPNAANAAAAAATANSLRTLLPSTGRWLNWEHILNAGIANFSHDATRNNAFENTFPASYDIEAFHESGTDFHRFNLARTDWSSLTVAQLTAMASAFWQTGTDSQVAASSGGIAWLSGNSWQDRQIAANLKDYSDTDTAVTTDATTFPDATATYVGLENAPYLNEIHCLVFHTGPPHRLRLRVSIELANLYATASTVAVDVRVQGTLNGAAYTSAVVSQNFAFTGAGYLVQEFNFADLANGNSGDTFRLDRVEARVYTAANGLHDLTWLLPSSTNHFTTPVGTVTIDDTTTHYQVNLQARDPRANTTNATDANTPDRFWVMTEELPTATINKIDTLYSTMPAVAGLNSVWDPATYVAAFPAGGTQYDLETVGDPTAGLSTAYIRNAPMRSLWELGAIHRGYPFQTLCLSRTSNTGATRRAENYNDGDARMLEHVKLTDRTLVNGKFNANSQREYAWRAMFKNVTIGGSYANPYAGTPLDDSSWMAGGDMYDLVRDDGLNNSIMDTTKGRFFPDGGNKYFLDNRGLIALAGNLSDRSGQTTDRSREELIGKVANLLTVRQNYYTVVVVGRAVRDLGPTLGPTAGERLRATAAPGEIFPIDPARNHWVRLLGEERYIAILYRDAFTNDVRVEQIIPLR